MQNSNLRFSLVEGGRVYFLMFLAVTFLLESSFFLEREHVFVLIFLNIVFFLMGSMFSSFLKFFLLKIPISGNRYNMACQQSSIFGTPCLEMNRSLLDINTVGSGSFETTNISFNGFQYKG